MDTKQIQDSARNYSGNSYSLFSINNKANIALRATAQLASLINPEFKVKDSSSEGTVSTSGGVFLLTGVAEGDGQDERTGNQIKLKSIALRILCQKHASATQSYIRVLLVKDTANPGSALTVAQVLGSSPTINTFNNINSKNRCIIMKEWMIELAATNAESWFKYYKKINLHCAYNGANYDQIVDNHLYLVFISNEATNVPTLNMYARIRYLDN